MDADWWAADDWAVLYANIAARYYSVSQTGCVDGLCAWSFEVETNSNETACYVRIDSSNVMAWPRTETMMYVSSCLIGGVLLLECVWMEKGVAYIANDATATMQHMVSRGFRGLALDY
jgi:hypothetical protein